MDYGERKALYRMLWEPENTVDVFHYILEQWVRDYPTNRKGYYALSDEIKKQTGVFIPFDTLMQYGQKKNLNRDPKLSSALPIIKTILGSST